MIRKDLFWPNMKKEVAEYLARCIEYQWVKFEHQHPTGLLQPLPIPKWKWEVINMDFITCLLKDFRQNDSIMVAVEKFIKEAHFILVKSTYKAVNIVDIFMKEFFRLPSVPKVIISNRDAKFTGNFWKALFKGLSTQLNFNTVYHPQMDGQT